MDEQVVVEAGERTTDELMARLQDGERLVVRTQVLDSPEELTLRYDGEIYYCDTPTRLHKHETATEMEECMRHYGYVADAD